MPALFSLIGRATQFELSHKFPSVTSFSTIRSRSSDYGLFGYACIESDTLERVDREDAAKCAGASAFITQTERENPIGSERRSRFASSG